MAQKELSGWPEDRSAENRPVKDFQEDRSLFLNALALDPSNRTAHHRLGLLALRDRDFNKAVVHLQAAHEIDRDSRFPWEIIKKMGPLNYFGIQIPKK